MKRGQFLSVSGSVVFGSTLLSQEELGRNRSRSLKTTDVHNTLRSRCDVSEPDGRYAIWRDNMRAGGIIIIVPTAEGTCIPLAYAQSEGRLSDRLCSESER